MDDEWDTYFKRLRETGLCPFAGRKGTVIAGPEIDTVLLVVNGTPEQLTEYCRQHNTGHLALGWIAMPLHPDSSDGPPTSPYSRRAPVPTIQLTRAEAADKGEAILRRVGYYERFGSGAYPGFDDALREENCKLREMLQRALSDTDVIQNHMLQWIAVILLASAWFYLLLAWW